GRKRLHGRVARRMPGGGRGRRPADPDRSPRCGTRGTHRGRLRRESLDVARPGSRPPRGGGAYRRRHARPRFRAWHRCAAPARRLGAFAVLRDRTLPRLSRPPGNVVPGAPTAAAAIAAARGGDGVLSCPEPDCGRDAERIGGARPAATTPRADPPYA